MQNRKKLVSQSEFHLIQVDILDEFKKDVRTSYEVLDPNEDVIGRFAGLGEAKSYIKLLSILEKQ